MCLSWEEIWSTAYNNLAHMKLPLKEEKGLDLGILHWDSWKSVTHFQ